MRNMQQEHFSEKGEKKLIEKKNSLTKKDLHCLARTLQGILYMEGDMFGGCNYCLYQEKCNESAKKGRVYLIDNVTKKLQKITCVYLGINTRNIENKLLINSFQSTNKHGNKQ